ncbi:MAG: tetratricopeptide repeat protein [Acidobacteriota bacterium]|nr:tetratricopeptide repeat protein [Acidobacteriota bacterium]
MKSLRTASPATALVAAVLLGSLAATPLSGETPAGAQRDQNRIVSEIRQIQAQLATLVEAQTALSQAVEALLADREEQLTADRQSRAETMNTLERMERSVATLSEAFRDTNARLSALMVEVESVREAQRRAALLGGGSGEGDDTAPPDGEQAETPEVAVGDESTPEEGSGDEAATVLDEPGVSEIYLQANADYLQGRYDLAFTGFERVAELGGELADNARYFMGECRLAQDRLDDALEHFVSVIDDFPESSKHGEAWYKRGLILGRMGHESDAREIFEDILDVFAGTTAARLAQRELDALPPRDPGV